MVIPLPAAPPAPPDVCVPPHPLYPALVVEYDAPSSPLVPPPLPPAALYIVLYQYAPTGHRLQQLAYDLMLFPQF